MKKLLALAFLAISLQGCLFVAGAAIGVAAAGAVVYDHRSPQVTKEDKDITEQIKQRLSAVPEIEQQSSIVVSTFNGMVLLAGQTPNESIKAEAAAIAHSVAGSHKIYNQIVVKGQASSLTSVSDTWITTKLKTQLTTNDDLESSQIQVVTENGTVYLMGKLTHSQGDIAAQTARHIDGVQKVVKIFQYTDDNDDQSGLE